jgi:hypothetical protein
MKILKHFLKFSKLVLRNSHQGALIVFIFKKYTDNAETLKERP